MSSKQISIFLTPIVRAVSLSSNASDDSIEPVQESPSLTAQPSSPSFSKLT